MPLVIRRKGVLRLSVRIVNWLSSFGYLLSCVCVVILIFSVAYEVLMRYVFNSPTNWSFEISSYLYLVLILLGVSHVHRIDKHIKVEFFGTKLSRKATTWNNLFSSILGLFFCTLVTWQGGEYAIAGLHYRSASILATPLFPFMVMIPVGFLLWGLQYLVKIGEAIQTLQGNNIEPDPGDSLVNTTTHSEGKGA